MRCERCKFENIPGQKTCIKCGSVLEIKPVDTNVHPPRASSWKKPFRKLARWMRRGRVIPGKEMQLSCPKWLKSVFSDNVLALLLSVVPGLAHVLQKRFGKIRLFFFAWLILLSSGLFLYGSLVGFICLGLAVGIHAAIALQSGIMKDLANLREKIVAVVLVLIGLALVYRYTPRILIPNLSGGFSSLTIPYNRVEAGDYLLTWGGLDEEDTLPWGSLVLIHPVTLTHHGGRTTQNEAEMIVQIVGLPGEQLEIQDGFFIVNGQTLDEQQYPVPQWLQKVDLLAIIPDNSYFVSTQYNVRAHGIRLDTSHILRVCLLKADDIEARAFMRWWPLLRRGFIR